MEAWKIDFQTDCDLDSEVEHELWNRQWREEQAADSKTANFVWN